MNITIECDNTTAVGQSQYCYTFRGVYYGLEGVHDHDADKRGNENLCGVDAMTVWTGDEKCDANEKGKKRRDGGCDNAIMLIER
jgi:hypothetical protein